jgi:hypothetical protein
MSNSRTLSMGNGISPVGMPDTIPDPLRGPLNAATNSRKRGITELSGPEMFNLGNNGRVNKRSRLEPHAGAPIPPVGGPIDNIKSNLVMSPYLHTPITAPQRVVNQNAPYTRIVKRGALPRAAGGAPVPVIDTIAKHQWGIMHRVTGDHNAAYTVATRSTLQFDHDDGTKSSVDMTPQTILSPSNWNYYNLVVQRAIFEKSPEMFLELTAQDIIKDWVFDGVCISEEMLSGAESARTSGFSRGGKWMGADGYKVVSMNLRNECHCVNVFGDSLIEGGGLYAIVRKVSIPEHGAEFVFDFNVAAKPSPAALTPYVHMQLPHGETQKVVVMSTAAPTQRFLPWQMFLVCVPDDGPLPDAHRVFKDEYGITRYDSEVIYLGKVLIAPQGNKPRPLATNALNVRGPVQDASLGSDEPLIKVLIKPRGHHPL